MTRHTAIGQVVMAAAVTGWVIFAPGIAAAQRAVPRDGWTRPGPSTDGESRGSGQGRWTAPPAPERSREAPPPQEQQPAAESGSDRQSGGAAESRPPARARDDRQVVGTAVPRETRPRPPSHGGGVIVIPGGYGGYYPWGYAGLGFGGYYDPWYGGYPARYYERRDDGRLRLKVRPRAASVYVDGYYTGQVDDFDGIFQSLPLEPGPYSIEIRADGYAPHTFDVRILPDRTLTYTAALEPIP
jgi:hypothetical protein